MSVTVYDQTIARADLNTLRRKIEAALELGLEVQVTHELNAETHAHICRVVVKGK